MSWIAYNPKRSAALAKRWLHGFFTWLISKSPRWLEYYSSISFRSSLSASTKWLWLHVYTCDDGVRSAFHQFPGINNYWRFYGVLVGSSPTLPSSNSYSLLLLTLHIISASADIANYICYGDVDGLPIVRPFAKGEMCWDTFCDRPVSVTSQCNFCLIVQNF